MPTVNIAANSLQEINHNLVGGKTTPMKNMKVNGKDYPIYEMEHKKCLKPPASNV